MRAQTERFLALDSLRGVCACIVVFYHLKTNGLITNLSFFQNAWVFVDFFFVLSGFVISASYGARLAGGFSIRRFMFLRFGRIYPLHLAMLLAFLALECAGAWAGTSGVAGRQPFSGSRNIPGIFENLFLVDIFDIHGRLSWNTPSWSIQAEIWTYLIAAVMFRWFSKTFIPLVLAVVVAACLVLVNVGHDYLFRTDALALVRCLYGFCLGMLAWHIHERSFLHTAVLQGNATVLEFGVVISVIWLVSTASGWTTMLCPPLFMATVLLFARGQGTLSTVLKSPAPVILGTLSYSIYMIHFFVLARFIDVVTAAGRLLHRQFTTTMLVNGNLEKVISVPAPFADLAAIVGLLLVIALAWSTYRLIETPCREWSRLYARRGGVERAKAEVSPM